jgi:hypothetical protein
MPRLPLNMIMEVRSNLLQVHSSGGRAVPGLGVKFVSSRIREEIKDDVDNGTLPKLKASVRVQRFAGDVSVIRVVITDIDIGAKLLAKKALGSTPNHFSHGRPIKLKAVQALNRIEDILKDHNYPINGGTRMRFSYSLEFDQRLLDRPAPAKKTKPVQQVKELTRWDIIDQS